MSKKDGAIKIYTELMEKHSGDQKLIRPAFIERCIAELGMTKAGAATYYANNKSRGGATGSSGSQGRNARGEHVSIAEANGLPLPTYPNAVETDIPPNVVFFSSVQIDKQGKATFVHAWNNPVDPWNHAKKYKALAVVGAPEIGEDPTEYEQITEEDLQKWQATGSI